MKPIYANNSALAITIPITPYMFVHTHTPTHTHHTSYNCKRIDPVAQRALFDSGLFITKEKWREVKCEAFINPKHTEWPPVNVSGASAGTSPGGKWQVFGTRESLARCGKWIDVELSMSTERVEVDTTEDAISKLYERGGSSGGGGVNGKTVVIIDAAGIGGTSSAQSLTGMQEVSGGGAAGTERDRYVIYIYILYGVYILIPHPLLPHRYSYLVSPRRLWRNCPTSTLESTDSALPLHHVC